MYISATFQVAAAVEGELSIAGNHAAFTELVRDTFNLPVIGDAESNSAEQVAVEALRYAQYISFSIYPVVVLAISPVALSILISSPHCEARGVVVVVQAVQ